jgi:octopine/nopaline transport system substrate-binding protein
MRTFKFSLALLAGLSLYGTAAQAQTQGVLRVGTEGDAPNWSMAMPNGSVTGFDADISRDLCKHLQDKCKFVVQSFDSLIPSMDSGRFDVIISGLGITTEREKYIAYSIPYATTPQYFVVAKISPLANATDIPELQKGLVGKSVGVQTGSTYAAYIEKNYPGAIVKTYSSATDQLADFANGRIDAVFTDSPTVEDFFKMPQSSGFARVNVNIGPDADHSTLGYGMGVGLSKKNTAFKPVLDKAICKMINDGEVKAASEKWFGDDYTIPCKM